MGFRVLVAGLVLGGTSVAVVDAAAASPARPRGHVESTVLRAVVSNYADDTLSLVDVTTGTVTGTIGGIDAPAWLAASGDGQTMYVAAYNGNRIYKVNAATRAKTYVAVGSTPGIIALTSDESKLYVANFGSANVSVVDTAAMTVTATIAAGNGPTGIALTPDGSRVYVANSGDNTVKVINTATNTVTGTIAVGSNPLGVAVTPDGSKVLVSNRGANSLSVIDTATNTVTATVSIGAIPYGVAISPSGATAYIACAGAASVSVVDLATNTAGAPITVGSMPVGLSFTPSGGTLVVTNAVSGTLSVINVSTATVTSTVTVGAQPLYVTAAFVEDQSLAVTTASLPDPTLGVAYSSTPVVTGGAGPFTWSVSAGSLPAGLSLNATTGEVSGTPTAAGAASFTLQVTDSVGTTATKAYTPTVGQTPPPPPPPPPAPAPQPPAVAVTVAPLPVAVAGVPYTATLAASGGTAPYTWTVTAGTLPAGLTLNAATGAITGTPTAAGEPQITFQASDASHVTASATRTLTVKAALTIAAPAGNDGVAGEPYQSALTASGGVAPYTWSVAAGSLPAGLTLNAATGAISGTATAPGTATVTVKVTDAGGRTSGHDLTFTVRSPAPAGVTAKGQVSSVLASWTESGAPGVTGYTAIADPGPATCTTDARTATSCVLGAVAGETYTVTVVAHSAGGDSVVSSASAPATATAPAVPPAPPATPLFLTTDRGPITSIAPAQTLTFVGSGFAPFSTVVVSIYSTPTTLVTVTTDADGDFRVPVTIPAGLAEGEHTMLAQGTAPDGTARAMAVAVTAAGTTAGSGSLAVTGADTMSLTALGLLLLTAGAALVTQGRRRPQGSRAAGVSGVRTSAGH